MSDTEDVVVEVGEAGEHAAPATEEPEPPEQEPAAAQPDQEEIPATKEEVTAEIQVTVSEEKPTEPPVEEKPTEPPVEEKPTEPPVEEKPTEPPAEEKPAGPAEIKVEEVAPEPEPVAPEPEPVGGVEDVGEVKSKEVKRVKVRSTVPSEGVDMAIETSGLASLKPMTVGEMFQETYQQYPNREALFFKEEGRWIPVTFTQYYVNCLSAAKSFKKLGLEKYNAVAIIGFNSPEWFYSNIGAMFAGGLSAGIYTTNGPDACHFVASDCKANIIVVENQRQLDKILQVRDRLPDLKAIVQYKGKLSQEYENVYDWEQFIELGKDVENSEIEEIIKAQKPEECALLIYTSGTTGNPKGVMISHDNLTYTARVLLEHEGQAVNWVRGMTARIVTYLPLSHIAGQVADIYLPLHAAATVYFAQPDALKGSLRDTLTEAKPTLFFGVPRVYEKLMAAMQHASSGVTGIKKKLGVWAAGKGFQGNVNIQNKQPVPWGWTIANMFLNKVKERLGFQESKVLHVGAAPVHRDVLEYFMRYNIPVLELYGMSENSGPATLNTIKDWRLGSVGKVMVGTKIKIDNPDENGEGEICMYGRHVCMGYLNSEEKTKEAIDDEGWLHSGDIGRLDKDGFLFITGRIKEIIITSGGENVAPVPIESRIKAEVPFLSNVMLIGDKRKYLSCVVTLKCVMDPDTGQPKDELQPQVAQAIADLGCNLTKPSEIAQHKDEAVFKCIQKGLDKANKAAMSSAQKVQKFTLLESDFSLPGGELGPTLKLKRRVVVQKYESVIDSIYEEAPPAAAAPAPSTEEVAKEEEDKGGEKKEEKDEVAQL